MTGPIPALGLYVHWPFCRAKCPYCDFNSHVATGIDYAAYGNALCRELDHFATIGPTTSGKTQLASIFFGGGTPTLMPPAVMGQVISHAEALFGFAPDIEITAEANPTSVEAAALAAFKSAGVNRVSMGVQAITASELAFLGREHSADEAMQALAVAQSLFDRVSIDLIYGLPDQTPEMWQQSLLHALTLGLDHLSLYQLTIEPGTAFYTCERRGETMTMANDMAADLYLMTDEITANHGLPAYEVSNHARPGQESRHNLIYWQAQNWLGIGPGAHSRFTHNGDRIGIATRRSPVGWLDAVATHGHGIEHQQGDGREDQIAEYLMMGLRLVEGVNLTAMETRFGPYADYIDQDKMALFRAQGLLTHQTTAHGDILATSRDGRLLLNHILSELIV